MANYFISTTGNDANPGSEDLPWRNPWTIATRTFVPGDTIYLRGGTYVIVTQTWSSHNKPTVHTRQNGTAANRITVRSFPNETPILNGSSNGSNAILGISDDFISNYIVFDGIEVTNSAGNLMGIRGSPNNIIVRNCVIHGANLAAADNVSAIRIETPTAVLIENCLLYDIHNSADDANATGITIYGSTDVTIQNCEIYDAPAGLHLKTATGDLDGITLTTSYLHDLTSYGAGVSFAPGDLINAFKIYENVFDTTGSGLKQDSGGDAGQVNNMEVYNNVFYNYSAVAMQSPEYQGSTTFKAYNNICYRVGTATREVLTYDDTPNCTGASVLISIWNYNLYNRTTGFEARYGHGTGGCNQTYSTFAAWQASGHGYDQNSLEGSDPLFVGPLTSFAGFQLQATSPAKNLGRVGGVSTGAVVDAGAFPGGGTPEPEPEPEPEPAGAGVSVLYIG